MRTEVAFLGCAGRQGRMNPAFRRSPKTSPNSHTPPSQDRNPKGAKGRTASGLAETCPHRAAGELNRPQRRRRCYEHIDIPPIHPFVTGTAQLNGHTALQAVTELSPYLRAHVRNRKVKDVSNYDVPHRSFAFGQIGTPCTIFHFAGLVFT